MTFHGRHRPERVFRKWLRSDFSLVRPNDGYKLPSITANDRRQKPIYLRYAIERLEIPSTYPHHLSSSFPTICNSTFVSLLLSRVSSSRPFSRRRASASLAVCVCVFIIIHHATTIAQRLLLADHFAESIAESSDRLFARTLFLAASRTF